MKTGFHIRGCCMALLMAFVLHGTVRAGEMKPTGHDSLRISLLTCGAGQEIYTLFGHTAIRCENLTRGTDVVYNYGMFDFDTPNFVLRFALGETDYQLGKSSFRHFAMEYAYYGRSVWQQVLNLKQDEKERLVTLLEENYRPENRVYRYNFFYDNCATRPRDQVERALHGQLRYDGDMEAQQPGITFRHMLHLYSEGHPWSRFAMDLCMGRKADLPISRREMMFVPFNVQSEFRNATISDDAAGEVRPLVSGEQLLIEADGEQHPGGGITPMQCALALLAVTLGITAYGIWRRRTFWWFDLLLFAAAGLGGCVLAFLATFSQHPAVDQNYLLFVFHPLHLLCLPCMLRKVAKRRFSWYMAANFTALTLFMTFWGILPQRFPLAVLPLALCLLTRSVGAYILYKTNKNGQPA